MVEASRGTYQVGDLDSRILSTPYKIKTRWHVITGAPCSGKTTLIDHLAESGFQTAYETARLYFESEMAKGRTSQEIRDSGNPTQMGIFDLQRDLEEGLPPEQVVFLDRGLPDSLSFHRLHGLYPDELLPHCFKHRYASVFLLDRLPFTREVKLGPEEEEPARFIDKWLELDYAALGYQIERVPVCTPRERLAFVLEKVSQLDRC